MKINKLLLLSICFVAVLLLYLFSPRISSVEIRKNFPFKIAIEPLEAQIRIVALTEQDKIVLAPPNIIQNDQQIISLNESSFPSKNLTQELKHSISSKIDLQDHHALPKAENLPLSLISFPLPKNIVMPFKTEMVSPFSLAKLDKQDELPFTVGTNLPSLEALSTISCGKDFETQVIYAPYEKGFLFAVTLLPIPENNFKRIKKNVIFLVDHSNSIQKKRLDMTRQAIATSLLLLDKEDKFNIISFAHNPTIFSHHNLRPTRKNILAARRFLRDVNIGSFFYSTNFFLPFKELLANPDKKDELNIAILFSDGEDINNSGNQRILEQWTKVNKGNLSLYTIALNDDHNRAALEFFSAINKGKIVFANDQFCLKRKLLKFLKEISFPIAKNISPHAICYNKNTKVKFFSTNHLPNIYQDDPLVILGQINKLEDFTLFIQGIHADNWFNIRKNISFKNAQEDKNTLLQEWAIFQSHHYYHKYLINGDQKYLQKAKQLLDPWNLETAFH